MSKLQEQKRNFRKDSGQLFGAAIDRILLNFS